MRSSTLYTACVAGSLVFYPHVGEACQWDKYLSIGLRRRRPAIRGQKSVALSNVPQELLSKFSMCSIVVVWLDLGVLVVKDQNQIILVLCKAFLWRASSSNNFPHPHMSLFGWETIISFPDWSYSRWPMALSRCTRCAAHLVCAMICVCCA